MTRPLVSLTMIVRDEAGRLGRCLSSVSGLVDDVVVVDTGSADATREVAAGLGARVYEFPWADSFAAARNESLRHAAGRWAFWLDADEWLDDAGRSAFQKLTSGLGDTDVVAFMRQDSPLAEGSGRLSVSQPRLFRNVPAVRWRYRVHEQILPACLARGALVMHSDVVIRHEGYATAADSARKDERNRRLVALDLADAPDDPWALYQSARSALRESHPDAERAARRALSLLSPGDPLARPLHGLVVQAGLAEGNDDATGSTLRAALSLYPNDTILLSAAATLALRRGDLDGAASAFTALIDRPTDPDEALGGVDLSLRSWQARHGLAGVYRRSGRLGDAERLWRAVLVEEPRLAAAWLGLGELSLSQGRLDEADAALEKVRACPTGSVGVEGPLLRARILLARGQPAEATAELSHAIADHPSAVWPRLLLARVLLQGGEDEEAGRLLAEASATGTLDVEARRYLEALTGLLDDAGDSDDDE